MRRPSEGGFRGGSSGFNGSGLGSYSTTPDEGASPLSRVKLWIQENAIDHIVLPALLMVVRVSFFFLTSVALYTLLYFYLMPRALVKEPIYFDYSTSPPTATLNLFSAHKQWEYVSGGLKAGTTLEDSSSPGSGSSSQFLRSDFVYSLDVGFTMAKSQRNFDLGKFMSTVSLIDGTGDLIAKSSRPVVMPYQSSVTLFLDSVIKFPCRIVGICSLNEDVIVHVPMMTEYREPKTSSTESIELTLSSDKADIGAVEVTIMPLLRGIVYFMWYYPVLTALTIVSCFMGIQLALYGLYVLIAFVLKYFSEVGENNEDGTGGAQSTYGGDLASIIETETVQETGSSQRAETAPHSSTQNSRTVLSNKEESSMAGSASIGLSESLHSVDEDSETVASEFSSSIVASDHREQEIEAVLISESSADNPNLRRRQLNRAEEDDGGE